MKRSSVIILYQITTSRWKVGAHVYACLRVHWYHYRPVLGFPHRMKHRRCSICERTRSLPCSFHPHCLSSFLVLLPLPLLSLLILTRCPLGSNTSDKTRVKSEYFEAPQVNTQTVQEMIGSKLDCTYEWEPLPLLLSQHTTHTTTTTSSLLVPND